VFLFVGGAEGDGLDLSSFFSITNRTSYSNCSLRCDELAIGEKIV
jgi:hypothetical protein